MKEIYQEVHVQHGTEHYNFAVYEYNLAPGYHFLYSHWHHEYEIIYLEYGKMTFELDGRPITLLDNQAIFVNRYQIHSCCCFPKTKCRYVCIVFGERFLFPDPKALIYQKYILPLNQNRLIPPEVFRGKYPWEREILISIRQLLSLNQAQSEGYELGQQLALLNIFHIMIENGAFTPIPDVQSSARTWIKRSLNLIQCNYNTDLRVEDIARELNMCTEHFIRSFKKHVGKTPKEYLIKYRIDQAISLLLSTDLSVADIAQQCGFNDVSYFSRCFRKNTGYSALAFRKTMKKEV
ncbi:MAG: AraC family transcriptional regulator [Eubacteriales bacterium]|nr:AraC family transcriptional regulator [Eubacteriales bacterium]